MSKAVTNEEVEDVLSSIRRLVSEDKRPLAGLSSAPRTPVVAPTGDEEALAAEVKAVSPDMKVEPASDCLVLTPALRVTHTTPEDDKRAPLDLGSVARETWAPSGKDQEAAQDGAVPLMLLPADSAEALVHDLGSTQAEDDDSGLPDGDYSDEDYWTEEEGDRDTHQTAAESAVRYGDATPEVASSPVCDSESQADDLNSSDDDLWDVDPAAHDALDEAEALYFETEADIEPEADAQSEPVVPDANLLTANVPLTAKIAAMGAAIGKSRQDWEPDGDEVNDLAATHAPAMAWEDDTEFDAKGAPLRADLVTDSPDVDAPEHEPEAKTPLAAALGGDDQLMDEEALRDLVSEIVRSELQGALGERITRNVRKLVRREIHRALTAQEIE
jgi:hypothetical protein